jgi:hypothetical protein
MYFMKHIYILFFGLLFTQTSMSQIINFPDANFKTKLVNQSNPTIDTDNDNEISVAEAAAVTGKLKIRGNGSTGRITDLTGIAYFINATEIEADDNELITVDLSSNIALIQIDLNGNDLTAIDFSNNTALEIIDVGSNPLSTLDVSSNVNLRVLSCTNMQMTSLNVNNCTQLEELNCSINQFTSLDLSTNTALKTLNAHSLTQLSTFDISNNTLLETLDCSSGGFSTLDVTNNTLLTELDCSVGQVSNLIFGSNNTVLASVECQSSPLSVIDTSMLSGLTSLILNDNQMASIDVSQNTNLEVLELNDNLLVTVDLESNPNLTNVEIENNLLESVYLRNGNNNSLSALRLRYNPKLYCLFVDNPNINYANWYRGGAVTQIATEAECDAASVVTLIPDIKFEQELISQGFDSTPSNGEIPTSKINTITALDVHSSLITDLTGIEDFSALESLNCAYNNIDLIDVSGVLTLETLNASYGGTEQVVLGNNPNLISLNLTSNNIATIDVSGLPALTGLSVGNNNLTALDVTNNLALKNVFAYNNPLTVLDLRNINIRTLNCTNTLIETLDLSNSTNMNIFYIGNNPNLTYVNFKSGGNDDIDQFYSTTFPGLPNLDTICVDDVNNLLAARIQALTSQEINVTEDCLNEITGNVYYDLDANGCDMADLTVQNLMIKSASVVDTTATFSSASGTYVNYVTANTYLTSLQSALPDYFSVSPESASTTFTDYNSADTIDFCIEATQTVNDANVTIIPIDVARPGFEATYQIALNNNGTTQLDGSLTLTYDETMMNFVSTTAVISSQTSNSITIDYLDLNPFETRLINLEFNILPPPTVNDGDIINLNAVVLPIILDNTPDDNVYDLEQIVVNSFDPNDKQVLQGTSIFEDETANYLDYIVRFQNTGTASAINVRIEDVLDEKLDWTSLQPISSSHDYRIEITNDNQVEFIYDNINLVPQSDSEELSQGYIAFRVKPKNDVEVGDIISGVADIYFDFNTPITTNTVNTEVVAPLSITDVNIETIKLYPNPAKNNIKITSNKVIEKLRVYDINGRTLKTIEMSIADYSLDISSLSKGVYFLEIESDNYKTAKRFVKH